MALLKTLFLKYTMRKDRNANFGKAGEFLLEDAFKMLKDADSETSDYNICMVFSLSKHTTVINDYEESGQQAL